MEQNQEHSEQYLKGLPVRGGFSVPDAYFEDLEERLISLSEEEDIDLGAHTGFVVPEGYFDQLNERIIEKVGEEGKLRGGVVGEGKIIPLFARSMVKWSVGLAASLLLVGGLYLFQPPKVIEPVSTGEILEINEVADHIDVNELDVELLCDAGWCNEVENLTQTKEHGVDDSYLEVEEELFIDEL